MYLYNIIIKMYVRKTSSVCNGKSGITEFYDVAKLNPVIQ